MAVVVGVALAAALSGSAPAVASEVEASADTPSAQKIGGGLVSLPPGTSLAVEVHGANLALVHEAIERHGGVAYGEVPGFFVEADVPADRVSSLDAEAVVSRVSTITRQLPADHIEGLQTGTQLVNTIENLSLIHI